MRKIFFTGDTLTKKERSKYLEKGYQIDGFDVNLSKKNIVDLLNQNNYDGYILGGNEILDGDIIEQFPISLKVISFFGVGYESYIDISATRRKRISVTNTPDSNSIAVAEHTIVFIISLIRHIINNSVNNSLKNIWNNDHVKELEGKTIGIIGMGRIGQTVARMLYYGFNMKVIYYSRTRKTEIEQELKTTMVTLDELLIQSDIVSIHASLNDETNGMIGYKQLELMKNSALLINTARFDIIDSEALYEAIVNDKIAGCVLDTFYKETINLLDDDRFRPFANLSNKNLIIAPHLAYFSKASLNSMQNIAIQNVIDVLENKECDNIIKGISQYITNFGFLKNNNYFKYKIILADNSNYKKDLYDKVINAFGKENVKLLTDILNMENVNIFEDESPKILMINSYYLNQSLIIEIIKKIKNLKAICIGGVYCDNLDLDYCYNRGIKIYTVPNYCVKSLVDHGMFLLKGLVNKTALYLKNVEKEVILEKEPLSLETKKVGIIGLSNLGIEMATLCHNEGMRVTYYDIIERNSRFEFSSLENIFKTCDFIILANMGKYDQIKLKTEIIDIISKNTFVVSAGYESLFQDIFVEKAEKNLIAGYASVCSKNTLDYKNNILFVGDTNYDSREKSYILIGAWIEKVRRFIDENTINY